MTRTDHSATQALRYALSRLGRSSGGTLAVPCRRWVALLAPSASAHSVAQVDTTKFMAPETVQLLKYHIAPTAEARLNPVLERLPATIHNLCVSNRATLLRALDPGDSSRSLKVIWLDPGSDGEAQVTAARAERTGIDALPILSHGREGGR